MGPIRLKKKKKNSALKCVNVRTETITCLLIVLSLSILYWMLRGILILKEGKVFLK